MRHSVPVRPIPAHPNEAQIGNGHLIARMISVAAAHGPCRANCLQQSLVLWWMLARHHIRCEIRFGVPEVPEETFGAHAWVECDGDVLGGSRQFHQELSSLAN